MNDQEFQRLSIAEKAKVLGLKEHDDGKTQWRVGEQVWFRPKRSRKWRQGRVTFSVAHTSRGRNPYRFDFVRVGWVLAAEVSKAPPEGMCEHGYVKTSSWGRHPCSRCWRAEAQAVAAEAMGSPLTTPES